MGLIKAGLGAVGGVLADQWKEFFYCEAMDKEVMVTKGQKRISGRSSNTKGSDNIGLVVALIIIGRMKGKLKTVRRQAEAAEYVKTGSMKVTQSRDLFLYKHIDRHAKPKESTSGGSRTHTSSSGRTHGGGGGKF